MAAVLLLRNLMALSEGAGKSGNPPIIIRRVSMWYLADDEISAGPPFSRVRRHRLSVLLELWWHIAPDCPSSLIEEYYASEL
jgi:hypothetical protein